MNININFTIPDPLQLLVYIIIGLVAAVVAGALARMRSGLGYFLTLLMAILGAWIFASVLNLQVGNDVSIQGVRIIEAFIGALLFALIGSLLFFRRFRVA